MRRLLFFPGHRIIAYEWEGGRFHSVRSFEPDQEGRNAFRAWLEQAPRMPLQLLVDVIEEEFHVDRVPHVIGRDRAELHRRTARKHFRSTDLRHVRVQGRETGGRRDDRLLIAGLTNPEVLRVWLAVIADIGAPLKGIASLPLVGEQLLPRLGAARAPRVLVISQQVPSTLRQSYYERGQLRFSRLVPGRYTGAEGLLEFLRRELDQTLRFLETQRFRRHDQALEVFVLAGPEVYDTLREGLGSADNVTIHLVGLDKLASSLGMRGADGLEYADTVFGQALMKQRRPPNHYGVARLRRTFFIQRGRHALWAAAATMVLAAVAVGAGAWLRAGALTDGIDEARARQAEFERLYQERLRQLNAFEYRATDVKDAVDLLSALDAKLPKQPRGMLATVARVLDGHPRVVLASLRWRVSTDPRANAAEGGGGTLPPGRLAGAALEDAPLHRHVLLQADVVDFGGNYRRAVELFEAFVTGLEADETLVGVQVVEAPFDLDPASGVSGESGASAGNGPGERASFRVRVHGVTGDGTE